MIGKPTPFRPHSTRSSAMFLKTYPPGDPVIPLPPIRNHKTANPAWAGTRTSTPGNLATRQFGNQANNFRPARPSLRIARLPNCQIANRWKPWRLGGERFGFLAVQSGHCSSTTNPARGGTRPRRYANSHQGWRRISAQTVPTRFLASFLLDLENGDLLGVLVPPVAGLAVQIDCLG